MIKNLSGLTKTKSLSAMGLHVLSWIAYEWRSQAIQKRDAADRLYYRAVDHVKANPALLDREPGPVVHPEPWSLD